MERSEVYKLIDGERDYQDKRWNEQTTGSRGIHSEYEWLIFIQDYLTEAIRAGSRKPEPEARTFVRNSIRKIAAMGVACMEQNDTPAREVDECKVG